MKNGEMKLDEVYGEDRPVKASELQQVLEETQEMLTEMKTVINIHAEVIASHRHVLEVFVPKPLLAKAFKEYYEARSKQIDIEAGTEAIDGAQAN